MEHYIRFISLKAKWHIWNKNSGWCRTLRIRQWKTARSRLNDTAFRLTLPHDFAVLLDYMSSLAHVHTTHKRADINIRTQTGEAKKGRARDTKYTPPHPPCMIHFGEHWDLRDLMRGGEERTAQGGLRAITIYLSVCLFLLVPSPLSAVPLSPQASPPPPHITLICAANYTLPAPLPSWQLKSLRSSKSGFKAHLHFGPLGWKTLKGSSLCQFVFNFLHMSFICTWTTLSASLDRRYSSSVPEGPS